MSEDEAALRRIAAAPGEGADPAARHLHRGTRSGGEVGENGSVSERQLEWAAKDETGGTRRLDQAVGRGAKRSAGRLAVRAEHDEIGRDLGGVAADRFSGTVTPAHDLRGRGEVRRH